MSHKFTVCSFFFLVSLASCVSTPPYKEYALAQTALSEAKKFSADKIAPELYSKSLSLYKRASNSYIQKDYEKAGLLFADSLKFAKKAELISRLKQKKEQNME